MNEWAILSLMSVLKGFEDPPGSNWPQHEIEEATSSKWALEGLLQQVWDHPWTLASEAVEWFASKLEVYSETCNTDAQYQIFKIMAETIWRFLDNIKAVEC